MQESRIELPQDIAHLERLSSELENNEQILHKWLECKRERAQAETKYEDALKKLADIKREKDDCDNKVIEHQKEWREWLLERGFSDIIRPEGFEAIIQAIEGARVSEKSVQEYRYRMSQMEPYFDRVRSGIKSIMKQCGRKPATKDFGVEELNSLYQALEVTRNAKQQQNELKIQYEAVQSNISKINEYIKAKITECKALQQQTTANNEEDFRCIAEAFEQLCEYNQKIENSNNILRSIAGTDEDQLNLETELNKTRPIELKADQDQLQTHLKEIEELISADLREIGGIKERLSSLANNDLLGELLLHTNSIRVQLLQATKRWVRLIVCRHLLEQAQGIYERERQPRVMQRANGYLAKMTFEQYRILSPLGEHTIHLEDTKLDRKGEHAWSSGLADQVYLAIRLGLIQEFGCHRERLPIILDDVLLKFDPNRQLGTAGIIIELANENQIFIFSCQPDIANVIEETFKSYNTNKCGFLKYTISDGAIMVQNFV